jgi:hypothetical protein
MKTAGEKQLRQTRPPSLRGYETFGPAVAIERHLLDVKAVRPIPEPRLVLEPFDGSGSIFAGSIDPDMELSIVPIRVFAHIPKVEDYIHQILQVYFVGSRIKAKSAQNISDQIEIFKKRSPFL